MCQDLGNSYSRSAFSRTFMLVFRGVKFIRNVFSFMHSHIHQTCTPCICFLVGTFDQLSIFKIQLGEYNQNFVEGNVHLCMPHIILYCEV